MLVSSGVRNTPVCTAGVQRLSLSLSLFGSFQPLRVKVQVDVVDCALTQFLKALELVNRQWWIKRYVACLHYAKEPEGGKSAERYKQRNSHEFRGGGEMLGGLLSLCFRQCLIHVVKYHSPEKGGATAGSCQRAHWNGDTLVALVVSIQVLKGLCNLFEGLAFHFGSEDGF